MAYRIEVAGKVVEIRGLYPYGQKFCEEYLSDKVPDFEISVTREDIEAERKLVGDMYPDPMLEATAIHRKLTEKLAEESIVLFHGSALSLDGEAYLFCAPSGTGKSTHARLWREVFGKRVRMINDDKPYLKFVGDECLVFGSPWCGKEKLGENISVPLRAIGIIERDKDSFVLPVPKDERFKTICPFAYLPENGQNVSGVISELLKLSNTVPVFRIHATMDKKSAEAAAGAMRGGDKAYETH